MFSHATHPETVKGIAKKIHDHTLSREFEFIEDIEKYQKFYDQQIDEENRDLYIEPRMSDYGVFKTQDMCDPEIDDGNLTFYVRDVLHKIPYKVSFDIETKHVTCGLLPNV